jgi:outer membrane protein assembly factor BamE (lipoprotein component of BamABCDE complex)
MPLRPLFPLVATSALALSLVSCGIYHMPIQQGNVINSTLAKKVHKGMSSRQLTETLGPPVLVTPFKSNKVIYVYTLNPTDGKSLYRRLEVTLVNSRVTHSQMSYR